MCGVFPSVQRLQTTVSIGPSDTRARVRSRFVVFIFCSLHNSNNCFRPRMSVGRVCWFSGTSPVTSPRQEHLGQRPRSSHPISADEAGFSPQIKINWTNPPTSPSKIDVETQTRHRPEASVPRSSHHTWIVHDSRDQNVNNAPKQAFKRLDFSDMPASQADAVAVQQRWVLSKSPNTLSLSAQLNTRSHTIVIIFLASLKCEPQQHQRTVHE